MASPVADVFTAPAGQTLYAGRFPAPGVHAASVAEALTALEVLVGLVSGAPPPPSVPTGKYRTGQPYLFNAIDAQTIPSRVSGGSSLPLDRVGAMRDVVDATGWPWKAGHNGPTWIDAALAVQGTAHWASVFTPAAGAPALYSLDVTTALQHIQTTGRWNAWVLSRDAASGPRTVAGRFNTDPAKRPRIEGTYVGGATFTLACRVSASALVDTVPAQGGTTFPLGSAFPGTGELCLEFDRPIAAVASASMKVQVENHWSSTGTLRVNIADPSVNAGTVVQGVAAAYPLDAGLSGHASIIGVHRYVNGANIADFKGAYLDWETSISWDPGLVAGTTAQNLAKLPHAGLGKWIGLGANATIVNDDYTGDGFVPLAPGLAAMRVTMDKGVPAGDGVSNSNNGTAAANAHIFLPYDKIGIRRLFVRYYQLIGARHRFPYSVNVGDNFHYFKDGIPTWTDMAGKCSITPHHKTKEGGNSGTAGGIYGWTMRVEFFDFFHAVDSPSVGGWGRAWSLTDFQGNNPVTCRYGNGDLPPGVTIPRVFHGCAQMGGLGAVQYERKWYCEEVEIDLNSVDAPSGAGDGLNYTKDGILRRWMDGVLVYEQGSLVFRATPLSAGIAGYQPPVRDLGHLGIWFNWYHGGLTVNSIDRSIFITGLAWGESYIGPMNIPPALPDWVPPPGEITTLTVANGKLGNYFRDAVAPGFQPFYSKAIVNDYAGAVKNQHLGLYGSTMWVGSGHASGSNDNSTIILEYGQTQATFRRLIDPTDWAGAGGQNDGSNPNISSLVAFPWLESTTDGKPLSPHSWQVQCLQEPTDGGASYGTFWQAFSAAVGHAGYNAVAAHKLPITSTTSNASTWARASAASDYPANTATWGAPLLSAIAPVQDRIYLVPNTSSPLRWLNMTTGVYGVGSNATDYVNHDGNPRGNGLLLPVPERGMIVLLYKKTGVLKAQYWFTSEADPIIRTATIGTALALNTSWSTAAWCPVNARFIIAGVTGDTTAFYELAIPTDPTTTWPVERAPFASGQTFTLVEPSSNANAYGKFGWDHKARSIVYFPTAQHTGEDTVYVYRPRNT